MLSRQCLTRFLFIAGIVLLLSLNLYTLVVAYPESAALTPGINTTGSILAKDFSAYYVGAWRLWNNPGNIYTRGALGGAEPLIPPQPQLYKYLPSFLLVLSPLLTLSYQDALLAFNIAQFCLLPIMAFLLYQLLRDKGLAITFVVMVVVLLQPFPMPNWGFSPSYYWQWGEGQAKVLQTFLLLLSVYFGYRNRPILSGIVLAFGFFDPRFGLVALPMFLMYNWKRLKAALGSLTIALVVSNLVLFYPATGSSYLRMVLNWGLPTPLYYYAYIPLLTFVALMLVNLKELVMTFDRYGKFRRNLNIGKSDRAKVS